MDKSGEHEETNKEIVGPHQGTYMKINQFYLLGGGRFLIFSPHSEHRSLRA